MCEPEALLSTTATSRQTVDIFNNSEYVQKFKEDSWPEYAPSYPSEMMTFYNGVHLSRYFGYKGDEESQNSRSTNGDHILSYNRKFLEKSSSPFELSAVCSCGQCNTTNKPNIQLNEIEMYQNHENSKTNRNRVLLNSKEKYLLYGN